MNKTEAGSYLGISSAVKRPIAEVHIVARQKRERKAEPVAAITPAAEEATDKSPNDVLAEEISDALVSAGLVLEKHRGDLLGKLKAGGVSQDDWGLWIDMATAPNSRTAGSEGNDNG